MQTITESGMNFGPHQKQHIFHIEKSQVYQKIQHNLKIGEFLLLKPDNCVDIIFDFSDRQKSAPAYVTGMMTKAVTSNRKRSGVVNK